MEGILTDAAMFGSATAIMGWVLLLVAAVCVTILGYTSDGEAEGKRFHWAEWPLPESKEATPAMEELRLAA